MSPPRVSVFALLALMVLSNVPVSEMPSGPLGFQSAL
jgi:hypothetical protein